MGEERVGFFFRADGVYGQGEGAVAVFLAGDDVGVQGGIGVGIGAFIFLPGIGVAVFIVGGRLFQLGDGRVEKGQDNSLKFAAGDIEVIALLVKGIILWAEIAAGAKLFQIFQQVIEIEAVKIRLTPIADQQVVALIAHWRDIGEAVLKQCAGDGLDAQQLVAAHFFKYMGSGAAGGAGVDKIAVFGIQPAVDACFLKILYLWPARSVPLQIGVSEIPFAAVIREQVVIKAAVF